MDRMWIFSDGTIVQQGDTSSGLNGTVSSQFSEFLLQLGKQISRLCLERRKPFLCSSLDHQGNLALKLGDQVTDLVEDLHRMHSNGKRLPMIFDPSEHQDCELRDGG